MDQSLQAPKGLAELRNNFHIPFPLGSVLVGAPALIVKQGFLLFGHVWVGEVL